MPEQDTRLILAALALLLAGCDAAVDSGKPAATPVVEQAAPAGFSPRPATPRLAPVDKDALTEAQAAMLASRPDYNIYKTLAHHPELYNRWSPLGRIILAGPGIDPRHREIAMLRMGWLCQSEYEWSQHARIAHDDVGMSPAEIHRIAEGADAEGWSDAERAVIRMVDDLRFDGMISDASWSALSGMYSDTQIIELMFTAAQYQLVSMALNSLGVQLDPELTFTLPDDLPAPPLAARPDGPRLASPRINAVSAAADKDEVGARLQNLHLTLATHPDLYRHWVSFTSYLSDQTGLSPRTRALLILRTGWNWNAEQIFADQIAPARAAGLTQEEIDRVAKGPDAAGWSAADAVILRAADELRSQAFVTDATWEAISASHTPQQAVEIVYTVGGFAMTALAINSLGVQRDSGGEGFPSAG